MADLGKNLKSIWMKGMEAIGNTASNIASNTKYKVDEMTLQNRRRELGGDLSSAVYAMWMKGTEFPPELTRMLEEMQQLDEQRVFMMLDTNVKLVKEGEDFYIYCMNDKKAHFYNCKGISEAFLEEMLECYREVLAEDGYDVIEEVEEIDLNELLDQ